MYLIPDDFSPERLKGKTIEQVCYSINQIGLFWENGNIQIMGSFSFSRNGRTHVYEEIYPVTEDPGLLCLLKATNNRCEHFQCKRFFVVIFQQPIGTGSSLQSPF